MRGGARLVRKTARGGGSGEDIYLSDRENSVSECFGERDGEESGY